MSCVAFTRWMQLVRIDAKEYLAFRIHRTMEQAPYFMELFPYMTLIQSGEVRLAGHAIVGTVTRCYSGDYSSFPHRNDGLIIWFFMIEGWLHSLISVRAGLEAYPSSI
jgi:hypothetical protein